MQATGLMGLTRGPTACMNPQFTVTGQVRGGDPQLWEHRPLAQIKYDAYDSLATILSLTRESPYLGKTVFILKQALLSRRMTSLKWWW